jgi:putative component of toxin-antitoxin plasmid stabilization module
LESRLSVDGLMVSIRPRQAFGAHVVELDQLEQSRHIRLKFFTGRPARVTTAPNRVEQGSLSNVKGVGIGVFEYRIDFGSGCRVLQCQDQRAHRLTENQRRKAGAGDYP